MNDEDITHIAWCPDLQLGKEYGADAIWLPWQELLVKFGNIKIFLEMSEAEYHKFNKDYRRWMNE